MPKRKEDGTTRAVKALRIYELLFYTGKTYSLPELSTRFGWSKQTVHAAVNQITESGIGIVHEYTDGGTLFFRPEIPPNRPKLTLAPEDIQNLLLCRDLVANLLPGSLREEVDGAIRAATGLLPKADKIAEAFTRHGRAHPVGAIDYTEKEQVLDTLRYALTEHRVCRVTYRSPARTEPATYCIAPRRLVAHREALYLQCSYVPEGSSPNPDHQDMLLAVQRIDSADLTEGVFPPRAESRQEGMPFGLMAGKPFRVKVRFTGWAGTYVAERTWSADQTVSRGRKGQTVLEFTAVSRLEVVSWLLSFGAEAKVLSSQGLRRDVERALLEAAALYQKGSGANIDSKEPATSEGQ